MSAYKTKAALPGRQSHFSNVTEENSTVIGLVNLSRSAGAGNYGKSPQRLTVGGISPSVTAAMARFLSEGVRHWLIPPIANVETKGVLQRSAVRSPNFSGDLQSAENSADTRLADKPADLLLGANTSTKGISSLEQNHRLMSQPFGSSLACLRWRRLISPCRAVTINCAVLSPCSFTFSIASITSCGARACIFCDLSFFVPVAITDSPENWWSTAYQKNSEIKHLKWNPLCIYSGLHLELCCAQETAKPGSARTLTGPLTKPLIGVTVMAGSQHTQTHPKFTWRFLALSASSSNVIHITATTEREARDQSPVGCVMVFAGRLPVQEVAHG